MTARGIPYTVDEARVVVRDVAHQIDPYHRELMEFLLAELDARPAATTDDPVLAPVVAETADIPDVGERANEIGRRLVLRGWVLRRVGSEAALTRMLAEQRQELETLRMEHVQAPTVAARFEDLTDPHCEGIEDRRGVLPMEFDDGSAMIVDSIAGGAHPLTVDGEPGELTLRITRPGQPDLMVRYRRVTP